MFTYGGYGSRSDVMTPRYMNSTTPHSMDHSQDYDGNPYHVDDGKLLLIVSIKQADVTNWSDSTKTALIHI